ncbi:MAG: hypothetical protein GEU86_22505 [Actinophytocola sp.]|nr:hypothetical protein [Actinophytocola sp.]
MGTARAEERRAGRQRKGDLPSASWPPNLPPRAHGREFGQSRRQREGDRVGVEFAVIGVAGFLTAAVGLVVTASVPTIAGAAAGAGFMMATVALNTRIRRRVPDELRGDRRSA